MKNVIEKGTLIIYFEGEVNSFNSEEVEREVDELVSKEGFNEIKIDMTNLRYISSAGLRIIVRLKQRFNETSLVNVPRGVYDIFEMVGFINMFKIEKL